jgi:ABC-type transporter Mla subunit MlaD
VKADYESGARESQQDNPETSGDEEADEQAMNGVIFAQHGPALSKAYFSAVDVYISFSNAADDCAAAAKEIAKVIKAANKALQRSSTAADKAVQSSVDALAKAARELLGLQAELKKTFRPLNNTQGILNALKDGKGAALGLLDRAVLNLPNLAKSLEDLAKLVEENPVGGRIG